MRFFLSGGHVYLLDPVPRLHRRRYLFDDDEDNPQEQATSIFESRDVRGELVIGGGLAVGRDSHDHLVFTVAQRALKLNRIPFSVSRRKGGCPFSPTRGNQGGSSRFARKRFTLWSRGIVNTSGLVFLHSKNFVNDLLIYPRLCTKD